MRHSGRLFSLLVLVFLALPAWAGDGDFSRRSARVTVVSGTVRTVGEDGNWVVVAVGGQLVVGDRVVTESGARAAIDVGSSTVRLGPGTDVRFERVGGDALEVRFDRGELALRVRSPSLVGEISVQTDEGRFVARHVGQFRFDRVGNGTLKAMAWSGDAPGSNGAFPPMGMPPVNQGSGGRSMSGMSPRGGHR